MNRSIILALALWLALFAGAAGADPIEFEIEARGPISINGLELVPEGSMVTISTAIDISAGGPPPPDTTAPEPPTNFAATPGDNQVTLTWTASVSGDVEDYAIERAFDDGFPIYIPLASGLAASPYVDSTAVNGNDYLYKIRAFDEADNASAYAGPVSATPESSYDPAAVAGAEFFADFTLAAHVTMDTGRADAIVNQVASDTWGDLAGVPGTDGGAGPEWTEGQGVQIGNHATTGYLTFGSRLTGMDDFTMIAAAEISTLGILAGVPSSPVSRVSIAGTVLTALADDDSETATVSASGTHVWSIVKAGRSLTIYEDGARVYSGLFAASQPFALERLGQTSGVASTTQDLLYKALWAGAVALEGADRRAIEGDLAARFGVTLAAEALDNAVSGAVDDFNLTDAGSVTLNETPDPDRIASVASQWGTGATLAEASEASQPDAVGGAYFPSPGDNRRLTVSPDIAVGDSFTIYMVLGFDSGGGGDVLTEDFGPDCRFGIESDGDAKIEIAGTPGTIAAGLSVAAGTRIIVFKKAAGVVSIYEDGTLLATDSSTWSATAAFESEQIGVQSTFDGHVATLGLAVKRLTYFSVAHSDDERAIVEAQLTTDHGL